MHRSAVRSILLVFLLSSPLAAQESFRVLRAGSDCGTLTLRFETMANGYRQCELREERRYVDVNDRSADWRRVLTVLVDSSFSVVALRGRESTPAGDFRISGAPSEGTLYLSREDAHGSVQSWRVDGSGVPDVFLPLLVTESDVTLPDRVFFVRDLATRPTTVKLSEGENGGTTIGLDDGSVIRLSRDGFLDSWGYPGLELCYTERSAPVSGVEPCDIDCGVFWDAGQAVLPTPPENVRALRVRLTLTRDVGARLAPEDQRQRFTEQQPEGNSAVNLRISRIRAKHGDEELPVRDEQLLAWLGESPLIRVAVDAVRDRAAILRAVNRSMGGIVTEMQRWMEEHFSGDDIVPLAPSDRLVRAPRGNCFNAAVLLTAIARAAGIPARLVLGLQVDGDRWRSTVWTELWTGDWVSIDPLTGAFVEDALHVKLLHAADETELREQARRLRGALVVNVLDVEEMIAGTAGALRTGILNGVYTDRDFRSAFRSPQGWHIERRAKATETEVTMWPETGSSVRCEVLLSRYPFPITTQDAFDAKVRALRVVLDEVEIAEKGEIRIGQTRAPYVLYSYRDSRPSGGGARIMTADVVFTIADRGYNIRFTAPAGSFRDHDAEMQDILQNVMLFNE